MKKILITLLVALMLIVVVCSFLGCSNGDRYELTYIYGLGISTEVYEYNYIDFNFDNNTYVLKNKVKANGIVSHQTGKFYEDQFGGVTITNNEVPSQNYVLYYRETLLFSDDYNKFYASATIDGTEVVMIFTKK